MNQRRKILELSDKAIGIGDAAAFQELLDIFQRSSGSLKLTTKSEMDRIKIFYSRATRIKDAKIWRTIDGERVENGDLPTTVLLADVINNSNWYVRAKATKLLGSRKHRGVPETLVKVAKSDPRLDVRAIAIKSFRRVTGYDSPDSLNSNIIEKHLEENAREINERMTDPT